MAGEGLFVPFNAGKKGRPRKHTPQSLLKEFEDYVNDRMSRPIEIIETEEGFIGKSRIDKTKTKSIPHPMSIRDFCVHLGVGDSWFRQLPEEFSSVKAYIQGFLEDYQLKGAQAGVFNANIVARLLGLADKKDITSGGEKLDRIIVQTPEERDRIERMKDLDV